MDVVQETPTKRRKLDDGSAHNTQGYDSGLDDGDEIFENYETIATLPLPTRPLQGQSTVDSPASLPTYNTQPTQIVANPFVRDDQHEEPAQIQVPASSPLSARKLPTFLTNDRTQGGKIASTIAPPGCSFRPPPGVISPLQTAKEPVIDLSDDDDGPVHHDSSDEDMQVLPGADIKPSTFIAGNNRSSGLDAKTSDKHFGPSFSKFAYSPRDISKSSALARSTSVNSNRDDKAAHSQTPAPKRSADVMANAYGGATRNRPVQQRQMAPAKASPAQDLNIDDIPDYQVRSKIRQMQNILPNHSVLSCQRALMAKRNNFDDAIDLLVSQEGEMVDLTISDGEDPLSSQALVRKKAPVKQQVKVKQNIQEKWTSTQKGTRDPQRSPLDHVSSPNTAPTKPRRRLVQGRKRSLSPEPPPLLAVKRSRSISSLDSDETDSGVGSEIEDPEQKRKLLDFINTCATSDLSDMATITEDVAAFVLSHRPFKSLEDARQVSNEVNSYKKRAVKKPIGDKIVDKCLDMWAGYEAVDELVKRCEEISKPLKEDMRAWGVDVFGNDALDITNIPRDVSPRDSGIGTPASLNVSDTDGEGDVKTCNTKTGLFPQPLAMAEGVQLKDYQLVGVNWLSLLFERGLSSILADDMGLGKTIQVIGFLAHLQEKGIKGPHLVVVPSSTLENWLKEFSVFCPILNVMPYYASQNERPGIQAEILENQESLNVVVTTYTLAKTNNDNKFLRRLRPTVLIFDEGHMLKNPKSNGYEAYMRIPSRFRLLLTGTPLQNNLKELAALLSFILPSVFEDHKESLEAIFSHKAKTSDTSHAALLSNQRIARAKSMLTPFILRRKKHQVLKHLPAKHTRLEFCDLSPSQIELYEKLKARAHGIIAARAAGKRTGNESTNIMMLLRQVCNHPMLSRRLYTDSMISKMSKELVKKEKKYNDSNPDLVFEDFSLMNDMELLYFWYVPRCSKSVLFFLVCSLLC